MTAHRLLNRARMHTATTGTGTMTLGQAVTGCATFAEAGASAAATYTYIIEDGNDFELGRGTYATAGPTLTRDTVLLSKISGVSGTTKLTLSGTAQVAITAAAEDFSERVPLTTRGDLLSRSATVNTRLAIGTSGYALMSDGTDPAWTGFVQAGTGATTRTWQAKGRDIVSVKDFGATGDGVTDDSTSIQLALNYAATITNGVEIFFPQGRYYCANNSATRLQIKSSVRLVGAGMRQSVIVFNDSASASRRDLLITDAVGAYNIELEGLGFEGDWGTGDYTQRSMLVVLSTTGYVTVTRCRFAQSRYMSLVLNGDATGGPAKATVTNCEFYRGVADGCRVTYAQSAIVSNNYFREINDDAIAIHSKDDTTGKLQNAATVTGNRIVDGCGIAVLGAKHVSITGNSITRGQVRGIFVGVPPTVSPTEGNTAALGITITGNVIDTMFQGTAFSGVMGGHAYYICVASEVPTTNGSGYVAQRDGSGGIVNPFTYFYTNNTDGSAPVAGNYFINISGNTCIRTLAPTAAYSDYGFGTRYGRSGPVDPAITAAHLGSSYAAITLLSHAQGVIIASNVCWGAGYGLWADATSGSAYLSWRDFLVTGNQFGNFTNAGVYIEGEGIVTIRGNAINGDPLHSHANRTANGKWDASYANCAAFFIAGGNAIIEDNEVRNVGQVFTGASHAIHKWDGNTLVCNPSTTGYHADNIGIARPLSGTQYGAVYMIENGDPASATYGTTLNNCLLDSAAMPSAGTYVADHFVRNNAPSATTPLGWLRITTGTGHVLNTDWLAVGGPAFSSALVPTTSDGAALGTSALMWSDLFLASGGVINFNAGDVTLTHSADTLTLAGASTVRYAAATTEAAALEIGHGRSGDGNSYVDLIGDATYTDYGARFIRANSGANSNTSLIHRGTGSLVLNAQDAGSLIIQTNNTTRKTIYSTGRELHSLDSAARLLGFGGGGVGETGASEMTRGIYCELASGNTGNLVGTQGAFNKFRITDDDIDATTGGGSKSNGLFLHHNFGGSNAKGGRHAAWFLLTHSTATSATNTDRNYCALVGQTRGTNGDGGGSGTELGAYFGLNGYAVLDATCTYTRNVTAGEFNTLITTGGSSLYRSGIQIAGGGDVRGSTHDCAIGIGNLGAATTTWLTGIKFGTMHGDEALGADSTVIEVASPSAIASLIDCTNVSFTTILKTADVTWSSTSLSLRGVSQGVELGSLSGAGTPFIDFHSSGNNIDHDARIVASGGTGSVGQGALKVVAAGGFSPSTTDTVALGTSSLMWSDLFLASGSVINFDAGDVTITHSSNALTFGGATAIAFAASTVVRPGADDGATLGAATIGWSDLFLASGGVINFNNGNATLTHSAGLLTSSVPVSLGTSNALTAGSIELGHASDTTIARAAAGAVTVEGRGVGVVLAHSAAALPSTNVTSEEVLATIAVPAGAIGANGFLAVETTWSLTNNANAKTPRVRFGASGAGTGGTAFWAPAYASGLNGHGRCKIQNRNATNSQVAHNAPGAVTSYGLGSVAIVTAAIDTTAATEICITSQKATGTDTMTLESYTVWLYYKA
jgi:hypothetical protein